MRICKRRYHIELQRLNLAARMVEHEARTETIRRWSGVSEQRVRDLYRAFRADREAQTVRHRGPAPRKPSIFLKAALPMRSEAVALAALCHALEVITPVAARNARRELETVRQGELLCRTYEFYRRLVGPSELTLEHTALLVTALTDGSELRLGRCVHCRNAILFDPCDRARRVCSDCCGRERDEGAAQTAKIPQPHGERPVQQTLF